MKIVIAADKFKQSLSSVDVCRAIREGLLLASPAFDITSLPLSDGGDGLAEILAFYSPFEKVTETVCDPLWRPVKATWLYAENEHLAFIEMAQASGLHLLQPSEYNCAATTTYGTGQLIKKALEKGARKIIIGIGGSATNDCGIGMAAALGYRFLDAKGSEVQPVGGSLALIETIDSTAKVSLADVTVQVACDVTNYLTGENGAAKIYAPQKGASPQVVEELEKGMQHFAAVVRKQCGNEIESIEGGGAAGGMGAGCVLFLGAGIVRGTAIAFHYSKAEQHIKNADVVITGEGRIDSQTWNGKLVHAVTNLCQKHNRPVMALCGTLALSAEQLKATGLTSAFSILQGPMPLAEALQKAFPMLSQTAYSLGCVLRQVGSSSNQMVAAASG
jgi:glycerate 2-kinase